MKSEEQKSPLNVLKEILLETTLKKVVMALMSLLFLLILVLANPIYQLFQYINNVWGITLILILLFVSIYLTISYITYLRSLLKLIPKYSVKWDKNAQPYCSYHESQLSHAMDNNKEVFYCSVCNKKIEPMDDNGNRIGRKDAIRRMKEFLKISS